MGDNDEGQADVVRRPDWRRPSVAWLRDWVIWFGPWRLVATSIAVVGVAIAGWWLLRPPGERAESSLPLAHGASVPTTVAAAPGSPSPAPPQATGHGAGPSHPDVAADDARPVHTGSGGVEQAGVVVHVAGAVRAPGVYEVPSDSRVNDAIARAGGFGPKADPDAINLAALVVDGSRVYVPKPGEAVPAMAVAVPSTLPGGGETMPSELIDVNEASLAELELLPGVGPATGQAIIDHREANGAFASVDELEDVRGIGPATLDAVRDLVTV